MTRGALWSLGIGSVILFATLLSCEQVRDLSGPVITVISPIDGFKVEVGKSLPIQVQVINDDQSKYTWMVGDQVVATEKNYTFAPLKVGTYKLSLKVSNSLGSDFKSIDIYAFSKVSPFINKVFDYRYAPGQHASLIPSSWNGDDFIGEPWINQKSYTSLGGWGGYIVAGFDHQIKNGTGPDFAVYAQPGAGSEPGIIYVMEDSNGDGLPNDGNWLMIKGSEYDHIETIHNYQVTYFKPNEKGNVTWKDNKGNRGELIPTYTSGSWWWSGYGNQTEVTFTGERLPNAYQNTSLVAGIENWNLRPGLFSKGYAECYNNLDYNSTLKANLIDISDAIDSNGQPSSLKGINFIKVQSGVFQIAGWLNEISTEVSGAADLSLIQY